MMKNIYNVFKKMMLLIMINTFTISLFAQDFEDVSLATEVVGHCGMCGHGGGVSFVDFNGDGYDDLTFATADGQNVVFYQYNTHFGTFDLIPAPVINTGMTKTVLWVDFDNDGDKDLFLANEGSANRLYENDGSLDLTDITVAAGLPLNTDPSYGAVFGDYNNDGFLDLYIANRSIFLNHTNYMYKNNGDGTFTDVTVSTGTGEGYNYTFCSAFLDINNDGLQDLYNSDDKIEHLNTMFKNNGDETFSDISSSSNTDLPFDAMNVGVGDYDNDGDQDIYVTNSNWGNALLRNNGDETFTDVADETGTLMNKISWGGNFFDVDNDMDLDLYVSASGTGDALFSSELFLNEIENDSFSVLECPGMTGDTINSYANAIGDFNNDGLPDIAVNNSDQTSGQEIQFQLWENTTSNGNNWVKVDLVGVESNRDGIGSWIEVYIDGNKYVRYKHCGIAYLAQNSATELIGLGSHTTIDSIKVRWLSGNENILFNVPANTTQLIEEDTGPLAVEWGAISALPVNENIKVEWTTLSEKNNDGFDIQRSTDGLVFENINWVDGKVDAFETNKYSMLDQDVRANELYYYRIKQMDVDGQFEFSKVVSAKVEQQINATEFSFYPNPTRGNVVTIELNSGEQGNALFQLFNMNGQRIIQYEVLIESGINSKQIKLPDLPAGVYVGKLKLDEKILFDRLVIQ